MKRNHIKRFSLILVSVFALTAILAGCGETNTNSTNPVSSNAPQGGNFSSEEGQGVSSENGAAATELQVQFGDSGSFVLHLEDNDTAAAIARYVGTEDWNLPIYHYDDFEHWEQMQYYDIPSRYDIPSNPQSVTSEQAGEVYYSEPNRIVLFYQDTQVSGEYTKVGTIENTQGLSDAVTNNPVVSGWSNKIVSISVGE